VSPTIRRAPRVLLAALLASSMSGCFGRSEARNPFAGSTRGQERIRIRVENQNFNDATIHAVRGGERVRLGEVTGKSDKDFTLRWSFSVPLEFEIHLVGGGSCSVRPMHVDPGDRVWVRIPTELYASLCISGKT